MKKNIVTVEIRKILIIHLRRIGDILLCTPSIRSLREFYPDAEITFLTEEPFYDVLSGNPCLDNIILLKNEEKNNFIKYAGFLKRLYRAKYDLVVDFYGNPRSSLITFLAGSKYRLGFNYRVRKIFYNIIVPVNADNRYVVQVKFDLLRKIGILPESEKLDIFIPPEVKNKINAFFLKNNLDDFSKLAAFSPTSRRRARRWFPERFAELGDRLINSGNKVIFIWGPGERDYIDSIVSLMKQKPIISFETTIKETAGILEKCRVLVTNFNGSMHLAVAVGTPTVGLCEPSEVPCWNPPANERHIAIYKDVTCAGCAKKKDCADMKCMKLITVNEVETAVNKMLNIK